MKTFTGYAAVFSTQDNLADVILPGAFAETLANGTGRNQWPLLLQHDSQKLIGWVKSAVEDAFGLFIEFDLLENAETKTLIEMIEAKFPLGLSIGYRSLKTEVERGDTYEVERRILKKLLLLEVSIVTFPAHDDARIGEKRGS